VATGLRGIVERHGARALGALVSPHATLEELALAGRLMRGLGSENVDARLRRTDFRGEADGIRWLGLPIAELAKADRVLVVGSFLRNDHPLLANRLRQAAKKKLRVLKLGCVNDDWLLPVAQATILPPSQLPRALAGIVAAAAAAKGAALPPALNGLEPDAQARAIAQSLLEGEKRVVLLGNLAEQHPAASQLHALAQALCELTGATLGFTREAANSVGADLAGARPGSGGLDAQAMLAEPRNGYLMLHAEAEFDCADPVAARAALDKAEFVVVASPFKHGMAYADVLLPIAPFTETSGTFVSCEGRVQSFRGVVKPRGDARPGWKVLRVLGTMLGLSGFDADSSEAIRDSVLPPGTDVASRLDNRNRVSIDPLPPAAGGVERVADVPIYFADPLVRRAESLQQTRAARPPKARVHRTLLDSLGLAEGGQIRIRQGRGEAVVAAIVDQEVPPGVIRLSAAHASTCGLPAWSGAVSVERA